MIKEIKYFIYLLIIILFFFLSIKYYISNDFEKKFYRTINNQKEIINKYSNDLVVLQNDTNNIIEYIDNDKNTSEKSFEFWKLLDND